MVHLIPSLLTNLYSMTAIEAKYVELCKYTVAYVGFNFLNKKCSCCRGGCATHVDPTYISPGDTWFDGSAVLYYGLVLVELVRSQGGNSLPLRENFAWKGSAPTVPTIFGVVSQRAELSRWAEKRAHGRDSTSQPYVNDVSRFVFRAVSHQGDNVLITDVVSNSAKH